MPATGFTMIPNEVIFSEITPQAKALFVALSSYADSESGKVWPSRKTLAAAMGMKQTKSVDKYIAELEDERFIKRQFRPNQSTLYEVARWSNGRESCRLTIKGGTPQRTTPSTPQGTTQYPTEDYPQYPTGDTNNTHSTIPTNQTQSLTKSIPDLGTCGLDAPRRGGQPPAEETRAAMWEEREASMVDHSLPVDEEETKGAGDGVDIRPLMNMPRERLSPEEIAAMTAAKLGWEPHQKTWVKLPWC
ncbi:helix-turn-helix domain-containing protein [Rhodococcus sp. BP22]|uniref:helix-turn-helix domain-containing protein n=1 Tax=Rhodococcus sp. BP22 TaxID=2758566 RepID=UPI001646CBA1|nr:helix-turn-helix domain-containing protein [Rhodococcus sp. BP22]